MADLRWKSIAMGAFALLLIATAGFVTYMSRMKSSNLYIEQPTSDFPRSAGQRVPLFSGKTLEGEDFRFDPGAAQKTIVVFWASWCPPCLQETPSLVELAKRRPDWRVIAISNDSSLAAIKDFMKLFPGMRRENIVLVWDSSRELANAYGLKGLPESFIVERDGRLNQKFEGAVDWSKF